MARRSPHRTSAGPSFASRRGPDGRAARRGSAGTGRASLKGRGGAAGAGSHAPVNVFAEEVDVGLLVGGAVRVDVTDRDQPDQPAVLADRHVADPAVAHEGRYIVQVGVP